MTSRSCFRENSYVERVANRHADIREEPWTHFAIAQGTARIRTGREELGQSEVSTNLEAGWPTVVERDLSIRPIGAPPTPMVEAGRNGEGGEIMRIIRSERTC